MSSSWWVKGGDAQDLLEDPRAAVAAVLVIEAEVTWGRTVGTGSQGAMF